jgi:hypothetical protein
MPLLTNNAIVPLKQNWKITGSKNGKKGKTSKNIFALFVLFASDNFTL